MAARLSIIAAVAASIVLASVTQVIAAKRVALVIGISAYEHVPRLGNPMRDAAAVAAMFKNIGFDVVEMRRDVGIVDLRRAVREFAEIVTSADVAVVYYAGHGIEVDGNNYLIPADAKLESDFDVEDETISLDRVLRAVDPAKQLRLVILDACRENPFAKTMKRSIGSRGIGRGLAKVEPATSDTLIAFAAKAGAVASDGDGPMSPFTSALVKHLASPGLDVRLAFGRIRDEVLKVTGYRQEPFVYSSLGGDTVALVPQVATPVDSNAEARRDYELAAQIGTEEAWESFLAVHSGGLYANLGRAQLSKLIAAARARAAEEVKALEQAKAAQTKAVEEAKAAEEARLAQEAKAAEKAKLDAQKAAEKSKGEQAEREAAQRKADEQAGEAKRLAAEAKAAEEARIEAQKAADLARAAQAAAEQRAAEQNKQAAEAARLVEEAKAERARIEAQIAAEKTKQAKLTDPAKAAERTATPADAAGPAVAALTPPAQQPSAVLLQAELRRVGCYTGAANGLWGADARRALEAFNRHAGTSFDVKMANLDTLDAVRAKASRVCPLVCGRGYRAEGERCLAIVCKPGFVMDDDGGCVRRSEPVKRAVVHNEPRTEPKREAPVKGSASANGGSAVIVDNRLAERGKVTQGGVTTCGGRGCQFVPAGCHAVSRAGGHGLGGKIFCP